MNRNFGIFVFAFALITLNHINASVTFKNGTTETLEIYAITGPNFFVSMGSRIESLFDNHVSEPKPHSRKLLTLKSGASRLVGHDELVKWGIDEKLGNKAFDTLAFVIRNTGKDKSNYDVVRISKDMLSELNKLINSSIRIVTNTSKSANGYTAKVSFDSETHDMVHFNDGKHL